MLISFSPLFFIKENIYETKKEGGQEGSRLIGGRRVNAGNKGSGEVLGRKGAEAIGVGLDCEDNRGGEGMQGI